MTFCLVSMKNLLFSLASVLKKGSTRKFGCLFKVLPFDISNPIMFTSLATYLLLESVEYRKKAGRNKGDFILTFIAALFVYAVVIYNVFTR